MMTFTNLKVHVTHALGNRTDLTTYIDAWVNQAYRDIWNVCQMKFHNAEDISTGNCTSAQSYITVPSGTFAILRVLVNGVTLEKRPWDEHSKLPSTLTSGPPTKYYVFGTKIYFDTSPASPYDYSVYRVKELTELSAGSDTPSLPNAFEGPLISKSIAYGYRALNMPTEASFWFNSAKIDLQMALKPYEQEFEDYQINIGVQFDNTSED